MIYESVGTEKVIEQGDIFRTVPRIDISFENISVLEEDPDTQEIESQTVSWREAVQTKAVRQEPLIRAILPVHAVDAIVITQSCDAIRAEDLSLCEIGPLPDIFPAAENWKKIKSWVSNLTKEGTEHLRFFYLPPNDSVGFTDRMAVDFRTVLRLPRQHLENHKYLRVGRLNKVAYEHFREKLSQFFRRYPYDPWYPLNKEEFDDYASRYEDVKPEPYDWQE